MREKVYIQYLGFRCKASVREYTLRVLVVPATSEVGGSPAEGTEACHEPRLANQAEPRDFTVTIPHEAFVSHRARYQDAPDICFLKLQRELATYANHPPETHYRVTDAELDNYRSARAPHAQATRTHKAARDL